MITSLDEWIDQFFKDAWWFSEDSDEEREGMLVCPLCGQWYSEGPGMWEFGEACGNQAWRPGEHDLDYVCPGILRIATREDSELIDRKNREKEEARADPDYDGFGPNP